MKFQQKEIKMEEELQMRKTVGAQTEQENTANKQAVEKLSGQLKHQR